MTDEEVLAEIGRLVAEEHVLYRRNEGDGLESTEKQRLERLNVGFDRCWDFLRQRRALRDAGRDPDDAHVRSARTVEGYEA